MRRYYSISSPQLLPHPSHIFTTDTSRLGLIPDRGSLLLSNMTNSEFHILKLKMADGRTIDVPVVMVRSKDGRVIKKMSYKQYKEDSKWLPPLKPSSSLQYLLEQKKKVMAG